MAAAKKQAKTLKIEIHPGIKGLFKLGFVVLLLYFLFSRGFLSLQVTAKALNQLDRVIPAFLASAVAVGLGVVRWQYLLRAQGLRLSWGRVLELTFVGNFFNIALPGAVSGDLVKAVYVGKDSRGQKSKAFGSILFDRVAGLSALVVVSSAALVLGLKQFLHSPVLAGVGLLLAISAAVVVSFYFYLFFVREKYDPLLKLLRGIENQVPKLGAITKIYEGLRHYHHHRKTVLQVLLISVCIHLLVGWSSFQLLKAVDDSSFSLLSIYLVVPIGLLITAVPVAPAGVGTGNLAFLYLFHLLGSERGGDTYSLMALMNILFGAAGGIVYLRLKKLS
jgi:hypothetical protein